MELKSNGIIGQSASLAGVFKILGKVAPTDSTVLVTGESGTGKELLVRALHAASPRADRPFVPVNCGAIPRDLLESELFGHEKGAFTHALRSRPGRFELADGGTLFLDEIGEMEPGLQVKILRVLQEKEIERVGGTGCRKVDVRIVAATNRDLWEMTEEGTFRQDLYYRLNVINIEVPPLRQRRDDIIPLVMHMLERFNQKYGKHKEIPIELGKVLRELPWRGNVRELENLIENLVVLCPEDVLTPEHLPVRYQRGQNPASQVEIRGILPMKDMVRRAERQLIANAQAQYSSMQEVAKALGVDVSTISRKLSRN